MLEIMKTSKQIIVALFIVIFFFQCTKDSTGNNTATNSQGAGGSTARFTIAGNYLYVVDHMSLKSFDISQTGNPVFKGKTEIGLNIETIFPYQDKLFIGSASSMYIYSLANAAKPARLAQADYSINMACDPVVAKDSVAYAALRVEFTGTCARGFGNSSLMVYNIKHISSPILMTQIGLQSPQGLGVKDSALYVCERAEGLKIFDVSSPYDPVFKMQINTETFYDVIPYGNVLICQVQGGFALYDIGVNPLEPVFISKILN
jgi:hypothetical protein